MSINNLLKKQNKNFVLFLLGAISSLIFPPFKQACFGYIALTGFLYYLFKYPKTKKALFLNAYIFGFALSVVGFSWINNALLVDDNQFIAYIPLVIIATGLFFGLFWAIPAISICYTNNKISKILYFTTSFVFMEWIRSFIFTGFPWNLLGTALSYSPKLIYLASYIGTYGLSFFLLLFLCGISQIIPLKKITIPHLILIIIPLILFGIGIFNYRPITKYNQEFKIRLVQPNIPQTFKWEPDKLAENFNDHIILSTQTNNDDIKLVVWGETATPYLLDRDIFHLNQIVQAIPHNGVLITGLLRTALEDGELKPYNSLFAINSQGNILDYYDKSHLVPFGEYIPFRKYLPDFIKPIADVVGDIGKGEKYKNIQIPDFPLMGGAICYESIFPSEVINKKTPPEILVVLANDGWYGLSTGPYQHLVASQMRAVEEGITVIRSANTGISAVIAPNGEIISSLGLNKRGYIDTLLPQQLSHATPYKKYGNTIVFILLLMAIIIGYLINKKTNK